MEKEGLLVTPFPYNHGDPLPERLNLYDEVWVLDIMLPLDVMDSLDADVHLTWIDHHETSIKEYLDRYDSGYFCGRRDSNGRDSACSLCWKWIHGEEEVMPEAVRLLAAYDVWDKISRPWEEVTLPFQYAMRNRYALDAEAFYRDYRSRMREKGFVEGLLAEGRAILHFVRTQGGRGANSYGFEVSVGGKAKALCILTDAGGSVPYEKSALERGCQVIITANRLPDGRFKLSCFSPVENCPVHLGEYLHDVYGGGGHRKAAGAVLSESQFVRMLHDKRL